VGGKVAFHPNTTSGLNIFIVFLKNKLIFDKYFEIAGVIRMETNPGNQNRNAFLWAAELVPSK
jgi:hypothetical protein